TLRVEQLNQSSLDLLRLDAGPFEAGGEKDQDPSLIPVPANSYFGLLFVTNIESAAPDQRVFRTPEPGERVPGPAGFSVDSGAGLTRPQQLSFVTGAPRANHTGAVVILRRDSANRLVAEAVLAGHQLTSAFGHALAVLDLNSDGCVWGGHLGVTFVTVGAPRCHPWHRGVTFVTVGTPRCHLCHCGGTSVSPLSLWGHLGVTPSTAVSPLSLW
ncbi:PREDICTED: integrin alpha-7-like, partial [Ficedula albicollis]|uniref:integrin alpha-7-like n=1 Tax=Ficedula albicollis TaxID=59894 RepID=UPI0007AD8FA2